MIIIPTISMLRSFAASNARGWGGGGRVVDEVGMRDGGSLKKSDFVGKDAKPFLARERTVLTTSTTEP